MIIAIIILSIISILSLIGNILLYNGLIYFVHHPEEMQVSLIDSYYKRHIKEEYPCTLIVTYKNNADFDGSIYDFSKYESSKIVGLTEIRKGDYYKQFKDEDDEDPVMILANQTVCLMEDGSYLWDLRPFM